MSDNATADFLRRVDRLADSRARVRARLANLETGIREIDEGVARVRREIEQIKAVLNREGGPDGQTV